MRSCTNSKSETSLEPLLVLALDGATFDVILPLVEKGRLPNLARWMKEGRSCGLASTTPPVTFPAWSSFMTGLRPAEHGIFDFTQKKFGEYRLRFINSTHREGASIFGRVSEAGGSSLVLGLPATHPPEDVDGLLVCGFDAPVSTGTDERSASDPILYREIADVAGPWMRPELNESSKADDFHERAVETLLGRIDRKRDFTLESLARLRAKKDGALPDFMMVVFSESDTAGHHYWRDHDSGSPRHDPEASAARRGALASVYERLDAACGAIRQAVGEEVLCVVLSDHGMGGASDKILHLNRYLAEMGLLYRSRGLGRFKDRSARRLRDVALAILPAALTQQIFRRARRAAAELESRARFGGLDWPQTIAFSEEANTNPGVWINLAGREKQGCVPADDYEAARDRVIAALMAWRLPSGEPVVSRALRREEVHAGRFVERAPDIVVELALDAGYGLSLVPTPWSEGGNQGIGIPSIRVLGPEQSAGGRGRGMNGTHRSEGIWIAAGPGATTSEPPRRLVDVAAWLARAMHLPWPEIRLDGTEDQRESSSASNGRDSVEYNEDEEAMVAERLRALGYLE